MILPFYFKRMKDNRYLISNILKKFQFIDEMQFYHLFKNDIDDNLKKILHKNKFYFSEEELENIVEEYRKINCGLFRATTLHIFVLTLACNLKCLYCQAECEKGDTKFMNEETACRSVDFAFQSPEKELNFEFQGGEPLLNFNVIKNIVEYTEKNKGNRTVKFSLVTNAQAMTEKILKYLVEHNVKIAFSIDGPKLIHDLNRPSKNGTSNFDQVTYWFHKARNLYERKNDITAISTITSFSISHAKEFIDFYVSLKVPYISIRELSPFGRVQKNFEVIGYTPENFLKFFRECMDYLIQLNLEGKTKMYESFSKMILQKIYGIKMVNYPDLRSPCGAVTGQIAYNFNGKIYTCDEGRMMANRGLDNFCIGDVYKDSYKTALMSKVASTVCNCSCLETNSSCENCVYNPICGICPVYSFFTQNDYVGVPIKQDRCRILQGIFEYLIEWMYSDMEEKRKLCLLWGTES